MLDLGCSIGFYCKRLFDAGFTVFGYEGTPDIEQISIYKPIKQCDLSEPFLFPVGISAFNIVCLEVGEHIPTQYCDTFLQTLCLKTTNLVMSWAVPNQCGEGHVNCRPNDWVIEQLKIRGFKLSINKTAELRKLDFNGLLYFKKTIFVFERV